MSILTRVTVQDAIDVLSLHPVATFLVSGAGILMIVDGLIAIMRNYQKAGTERLANAS